MFWKMPLKNKIANISNRTQRTKLNCDTLKEQGDLVRELKSNKVPDLDVKAAVSELKKRKKQLQDKENVLTADEAPLDRAAFEACLKKRFFYGPAFELYGGVAGLFDYGPIGCMLKNNLINTWRQHFVTNEDMLEIEATMMTPSKVLDASGHAERFADLMVKDTGKPSHDFPRFFYQTLSAFIEFSDFC